MHLKEALVQRLLQLRPSCVSFSFSILVFNPFSPETCCCARSCVTVNPFSPQPLSSSFSVHFNCKLNLHAASSPFSFSLFAPFLPLFSGPVLLSDYFSGPSLALFLSPSFTCGLTLTGVSHTFAFAPCACACVYLVHSSLHKL